MRKMREMSVQELLDDPNLSKWMKEKRKVDRANKLEAAGIGLIAWVAIGIFFIGLLTVVNYFRT